MKTKIEIKNRWTGKIIFEYEKENNSLKETIQEYIKRELASGKYRANLTDADLTRADLTRANLTGANLTDANLTDANLTGANLTDANLTRANLTRANLTGANLTDANLTDADLTDANLTDANLTDANLTGANLTDANLTGANLTRANLTRADLTRANLTRADLTRANLTDANLTGANLTRANLTRADLTRANLTRADLTRANLMFIKTDFFYVLLHGLSEIKFLKQNIIDGKIDGSTYDGECACLSGTLENGARITDGAQEEMVIDKIKSCRDAYRPAERFFLAIRKGDTPENNQCSKLALQWIEEFEMLIKS